MLRAVKCLVHAHATYCGVRASFSALFLVVILCTAGLAQEQKPQTEAAESGSGATSFPRFRFSDPDPTALAATISRPITLLTDEDFAPWSFRNMDGAQQGIAVDMALRACAEAGLSCNVKPMPFGALRKALERGEGDAIISGLRPTEQLLNEALLTRPYYLSLGRFVARQGTSLPSNDARALAGKRLGFVRNSAHGVFLQKHYARSNLTAYDKLDSLEEALRTGAIDAMFADSVASAFWISGRSARNCCQVLGRALIDRATYSRGLFIAVSLKQQDLRDAFDAALDALEEKGDTDRIFTRYLPGPIW
jgi:polar amino acid transport system substrate-binding protein